MGGGEGVGGEREWGSLTCISNWPKGANRTG